MMTTITSTRTIDLPRDALWTPLSDFPGISRWSSGLKASKALSHAKTGIGAERRCDFTGKGYVTERVIRWEEGKGYDVTFTDTDAPFKQARAGLWLRDVAGGKTEARFTIDYEMKMGPVGKLLDVLMVRRAMRKDGPKVLADLEQAGRKANADPARRA